MNIISKYESNSEKLNVLTHGVGVALSLYGIVLLVQKAIILQSTIHMIAYIIFGVSLVVLFLCSTLYHAFKFTKAKRTLHILDHCAIYLLIAGSYTPYSLLGLQGGHGWFSYSIIWSLALLGIIYKVIRMLKNESSTIYSTLLYIFMGALCVLPIYSLYGKIGFLGTYLLGMGCLSYLIGTIFYSMKQVKYMHVLWHIFVMIGAACIYLSILYTT